MSSVLAPWWPAGLCVILSGHVTTSLCECFPACFPNRAFKSVMYIVWHFFGNEESPCMQCQWQHPATLCAAPRRNFEITNGQNRATMSVHAIQGPCSVCAGCWQSILPCMLPLALGLLHRVLINPLFKAGELHGAVLQGCRSMQYSLFTLCNLHRWTWQPICVEG